VKNQKSRSQFFSRIWRGGRIAYKNVHKTGSEAAMIHRQCPSVGNFQCGWMLAATVSQVRSGQVKLYGKGLQF